MLIDTHCHLNNIVKKAFDVPLTKQELTDIQPIIEQAAAHDVKAILNVGTSLVESINCIEIGKRYPNVWVAIGIHPNDLTPSWQQDLAQLKKYIPHKELKIMAIGECGMDKHYPDYNLQRQKEGFKAQIELALEHDLALVIHTRDAPDETLTVLDEYHKEKLRGTIHCFSEDYSFAQQVIDWGFVLGIGGTITYPKNDHLRETVKKIGIENIIFETDAPFLPPQSIRGKQNNPAQIQTIATYVAELLALDNERVAQVTTGNVQKIFRFP